MKNIIYLFIALSLVSCSEEFLDKQNPTQLGEGTFYQTEDQFEQAVLGIYGQLQAIIANQWYYKELYTDNTTVHFNQGNRGFAPHAESFEYWQVTPNTNQIYTLYRDTYNVLGNINVALARLNEMSLDPIVSNRFEEELKFFRAYQYFHLSQYFGDVVILTEPIEDPSASFELRRSPVSEVYDLIESDLDFAVSNLPLAVEPSEAGRLTKGAALTLQGQFWLTLKDYAKAKASLDQVINSNLYSLLPNYADIFDPNNKNNNESIFEVQFQGDNDLGESSGFIYNFYPLNTQGEVTGFPGISGGGWNIPTRDIISAYEEGDLRKDVSLSEGYTSVDGEFVPVPFIEKFRHEHSIQGRPNDNWPIYRYADVLLMAAEAINEQSAPTAEAYNYVNQIRERAGLSPISTNLSQEEFKLALLHERRIELAFENHRWFDLKRAFDVPVLVEFLNEYGEREKENPTTSRGQIPFNPGDYIFSANEIYFPIPERELVVNPEIEQNTGY